MDAAINEYILSERENEHKKKLKSDSEYERLQAYEYLGFTEEALNDEFYLIRLMAYDFLGFSEEAFFDENDIIRLEAYKHFGFDEKAFDDESPLIRFQAFLALEEKEKIFKDKNPGVRLAGYRELGFSESALFENDKKIQEEAIQYFEMCKEILNLDEVKYKFTEDEVCLLEMNDIAVFNK